MQDNFTSWLIGLGGIAAAASFVAIAAMNPEAGTLYAIMVVSGLIAAFCLTWALLRAIVGIDWFDRLVGRDTVSRYPSDIPLHELFLHIDPHVLDRGAEGSPWEGVGHNIKDAHADGKITLRGRVLAPGVEQFDAESAPMPTRRDIPRGYFETADFTYSTFDDTRPPGRAETLSSPKSAGPGYFDIVAKHAEVLKVWPRNGEPPLTANWSVGHAYKYLLTKSQWKEAGVFLDRAMELINADARSGAIQTWGRPCLNFAESRANNGNEQDLQFASETPDPIPREHWEELELFWGDFSVEYPDPRPHYRHVAYPKPRTKDRCYGYVKVNQQQFKKRWPPLYEEDA